MGQEATCAKCEEPAEHHVDVRDDHPEPDLGEKDTRAVRIVRLCKGHWRELKEFLAG